MPNLKALEDLINKKIPILALAKKMGVPVLSKRANVNLISCPVHGPERTPSCNLRTSDNGWHCFGPCSAGGKVVDLAMAFHKDWTKEAVMSWLVREFHLERDNPWIKTLLGEVDKEYPLVEYIKTLPEQGALKEFAVEYDLPIECYFASDEKAANKILELGKDLMVLFRDIPAPPWQAIRLVEGYHYLAFFDDSKGAPWGAWGPNLGNFPVRYTPRSWKGVNGNILNGKEAPEDSPAPFLARFYVENPLDFIVIQAAKAPVALGAWHIGEFTLPRLPQPFLAVITFEGEDMLAQERAKETMENSVQENMPVIFRKAGIESPWKLIQEGKLPEKFTEIAISESVPIL